MKTSTYGNALEASRQNLWSHLARVCGGGLVVAVPQGRRAWYELAGVRLSHTIGDLLGAGMPVDPAACSALVDKVSQ